MSLAPKKTLLLAWLRSEFLNFYNEDAATSVYYVEIIDQNTEHNTEVHSDTLYFKFLLHCIYKMSGIESRFICKSTKWIILLEDVDLGKTA